MMNKLYLLMCSFFVMSCGTPEIIRTNKPKGYIISSEPKVFSENVSTLVSSPEPPGTSFWSVIFWVFWLLSVGMLIFFSVQSYLNKPVKK